MKAKKEERADAVNNKELIMLFLSLTDFVILAFKLNKCHFLINVKHLLWSEEKTVSNFLHLFQSFHSQMWISEEDN